MTDESVVVERARRGDRHAFETIYEQHAPAAWRLALAVRNQPEDAGNAVAGAFGRVLGPSGRRSADRRLPVRLQLLAATRQAAVDGGPGTRRDIATVPGTTSVDPAWPDLSAVPDHDAAQTFERLPERWRSVLWLTEVEGLDLHETAAVIGLPVQPTTDLVARAHGGLREQLAQAQLETAVEPDCQRTALRLGEYVTETLSTRDAIRVRRHLDGCPACRARLVEIDDFGPHLQREIPILPLAVFARAEHTWASRTADADGPFGLILPGGRPVPPWAERALAGATAAVITLGITGAILAGGRSGRDLTPRFARGAAEQPFGTVDGETALGRGEGLEYSPSGSQEVLPQPAAGVLQIVPASRNPAPGGSVTTPTTVGEAPRGSPTPTTSTTVPPSGAPEDPDPEEPPSSPPTTEAPLVEARLDDGTGVSVGGSCTGIEVLNIVVGCEPDGDAASPLPPLFGS